MDTDFISDIVYVCIVLGAMLIGTIKKLVKNKHKVKNDTQSNDIEQDDSTIDTELANDSVTYRQNEDINKEKTLYTQNEKVASNIGKPQREMNRHYTKDENNASTDKEMKFNISDTDELKKAVIMSEILNKKY